MHYTGCEICKYFDSKRPTGILCKSFDNLSYLPIDSDNNVLCPILNNSKELLGLTEAAYKQGEKKDVNTTL